MKEFRKQSQLIDPIAWDFLEGKVSEIDIDSLNIDEFSVSDTSNIKLQVFNDSFRKIKTKSKI